MTLTYNDDDPEGRVWVPLHISDEEPHWELSDETTLQALVFEEADLDESDDSMYKAYVSADGDVELYMTDYPDHADAKVERLWIDDIDLMIERLQELKALAFAHFGREWSS
jgi:hypothetical protein